MLGTIASKVLIALFNSIIHKVHEWMMKKQLEQAESKAKASEAVAIGMKEKGEAEDKIRAVQAEVDAEWEEAKATKETYEMLLRVQEARKKAKIAKKEAKKIIKSK